MEKTNRNDGTCWPHFPGVIVKVEYYRSGPSNPNLAALLKPEIDAALAVTPLELRLACTEHEARIFGKTFYGTYEQCVEWCVQQKRIAAWHEEQLEADRRFGQPHFGHSLADELAG